MRNAFVFVVLGAAVLVVLAGCGQVQNAVRDGPQVMDPLTGTLSRSSTFEGRTAVARCPGGSVPVQTADGRRSCAHTPASNIEVGTAPVGDPALAERLSAQAKATGSPVAYTDGVTTVTVFPAQ